MENEIRKAFDQLQAEPQLTEDTRRYLDQVRREKQRRQRPVPLRRALCAAALCCLVLALAGGYRLYFTPTSVISIDINPSIKLEVNRFDRVIAVEGRNEDGQALADTLDVLYLEYGPAVEQVLGPVPPTPPIPTVTASSTNRPRRPTAWDFPTENTLSISSCSSSAPDIPRSR